MEELIEYNGSCPVNVQILTIENYPWHFHKDVQLVYVLDGEVELKLTYTKYNLKKNTIHYIHTYDVHGFKGISKHNKIVIITLKSEYFSQQFNNLGNQIITTNIHSSASSYKMLLLLKSQIFMLIWQNYNGNQEEITNTATQLLDNLHRNFRGFTVDQNEKIFSHRVSHDIYQLERVSRVIAKIYENYSSKLSLLDLAKEENINQFYLSHLFQNFTNESFRNFIGMVRVEMSEIKILSTNFSIDEISHDVGFSNSKYYTENFIKWFGIPPSQYRIENRCHILGVAEIIKANLTFDEIREDIEEYIGIIETDPICKSIGKINVDFKVKTSGKKSSLVNAEFFDFTILKDILTLRKKEVLDPSTLYWEHTPQDKCIEILEKFIADGSMPNFSTNIVDTKDNVNGLFSINLMKKPLYYLLECLKLMGDKIDIAGDNAIKSFLDDKTFLIVFNPDNTTPYSCNINFLNLPGSVKITEKKFIAENTCIGFWCQLNFSEEIEKEDFDNIEIMSRPKISYKIIPKSKKVSFSKTLEPLEIVFLKIEPN